MPEEMHRIVVIGVTGAGKTTIAAALAAMLDAPHIELDAIHWRENWTQIPTDEMRAQVQTQTRGPRWVTDGNYAKIRGLLWSQADTIVWLDYALWRCLWRVIRRTIRRVRSDELIWGTNRETLGGTLLAKDGLLVWAIKTHGRYRREFQALMQESEYAHLNWIRLRNSRQATRWLAQIRGRKSRIHMNPALVGAEGLEPPTSRM